MLYQTIGHINKQVLQISRYHSQYAYDTYITLDSYTTYDPTFMSHGLEATVRVDSATLTYQDRASRWTHKYSASD